MPVTSRSAALRSTLFFVHFNYLFPAEAFVVTPRRYPHSRCYELRRVHLASSSAAIPESRLPPASKVVMSEETKASAATLKPYIETLISGERHLTSAETEAAFGAILSGADEIQVGCLLTLLRARNETPEEIAGMVRAMNAACNSVSIPDKKLLDIVGTGGDGADTINISTASVVLAAACGCTVAKAGNRSVSSACGSADVLEALGVKVDLKPDQVVKCVEDCGVAFMFAPVNHPAMRFVAPVRKRLGVRTCFNILGPMTNAAGAQRAVIGVFGEHLVPLMAGALKEVGRVDHAVVIHGVGLDEISPLGPATILEVCLVYICLFGSVADFYLHCCGISNVKLAKAFFYRFPMRFYVRSDQSFSEVILNNHSHAFHCIHPPPYIQSDQECRAKGRAQGIRDKGVQI